MIRLSPALPLPLDRPARCAQPSERHGPDATPLAEGSGDLALDDWHDLFDAVTDRLRRSAEPADVLECVAALEQLSASLKDLAGDSRQQRLAAQLALAQALDAGIGRGDEQPYADYLARHGSLTSLPERGVFHARLAQALLDPARRQAVTVLYLGLEGLGAASDAQAPALADDLLWAVGARLVRALRAEDLVSHFSGGEFACLLLDLPGREALSRLARKLFDTLSAPWQIGAQTLCLRPSIGIATGPRCGADAAAWLGRADAAMMRARALGLGHAFHDSLVDPDRERAAQGRLSAQTHLPSQA